MGKACVFKDVGKSATDLLKKDLDVGEHKSEIKAKAPNGVKWTAKGVKKGDAFQSTLTANYKYAAGIEAECVLKAPDGAASGYIEFDGLVDNLTVKLEGESATDKGALLKAATAIVDYKHEMFSNQFKYDFYKGTVSGSGVVSYDGVSLGGLCDYDTKKSAVAKYAAGLMFKQPEFAVTALLTEEVAKEKPTTYEGSYYHKVDKTIEVAGKVVQAGEKLTCTVGAQYKLDKDTTTKAKVDSDGILAFAYKQKVNPSATLTVVGQVDTATLDATKHKVGLNMVLEA